MPEIIVAADNMYLGNIARISWKIAGKVWGVKLNDTLLRDGTYAIRQLQGCGLNVMSDPKLFDIPATMANGIKVIEEAGAKIITLHLAAGRKALEACRAAAKEVKLFGVTVLTSMPEEDVKDVFFANRQLVVDRFLTLARDVGLDGVVCAADCVALAKKLGLKTIVPGVRLPELGEVKDDDQVHKALEIPDSDYLVIGRPIMQADDPVAAINKINALLKGRNSESK